MSDPIFNSALQDFTEARRQAVMQEVLARLTGQTNELLSFEEVSHKLKLSARSERGVKEIPLNAIVGSVGRYTDFTRSFLPRQTTDPERWARVKAAMEDPAGPGWPPIDVYQVGEVYFVLDGNHRVSVARQQGFEFIEAHVVEVQTDITLTPDVRPDDLIAKAEYANFLNETNLARLRPGQDLSVSVPGQYQKLREHINVHRYFMGLDFQRDVSFEEAVEHWYDHVYLAIVTPIRERGMMRWFPNRTETDMYLYVSEHRATLEQELGWEIRPEAALTDLAAKSKTHPEGETDKTGRWRRAKLLDRYSDLLFREILVPVGGAAPGWFALEQAAIIARKESAEIHGLQVVAGNATSEQMAEVQREFERRSAELNLKARLAAETGDVAERICERALLTDLIVLNVAHPPPQGLASLASGLRSIIWKSARPILTVPGATSPLDNALVAFDGGPKSREALFIATYLAERWGTRLTIFTAAENARNETVQEYARDYLSLHEINAEFLFHPGPFEDIFDILTQKNINLVVMGSYGRPAWQEVIIGSAVNTMLRSAAIPLLICR